MTAQPAEVVFINGRFEPPAAARLSPLDAAVQHGVGLFETMLGGVAPSGNPWVVMLDDHIARLTASAAELGLSSALREGGLADAALETLRRCGLPRARLRITITGGEINALAAARATTPAHRPDPGVIIAAAPATAYPPAILDRGVRIVVADAKANPFNPLESHKTVNYWWRLRELASAAARDAAEALLLTVTNHVCGGCVSNLFAVRAGKALTPIARGEEEKGATLPSPVRPGVTRAWTADALAAKGIDLFRRMLTIADVLDADEVFLTNSSWGVLPVIAVEGRTIGSGVPGPVTRDMVQAWAKAVDAAASAPA